MSLPLLRKAIPKAKLTTPEALLKWDCWGLWGATWWHLNSRERKRVESRCLIQVGLMLGVESSPQVKVVLQVSKGFTWAEAKASESSGVGWIEIQDLKAPPRALKKQATEEQSRVWPRGGGRKWSGLEFPCRRTCRPLPRSTQPQIFLQASRVMREKQPMHILVFQDIFTNIVRFLKTRVDFIAS